MGTGSLFQFKLLDDWEKVVGDAEGKAERWNELREKIRVVF